MLISSTVSLLRKVFILFCQLIKSLRGKSFECIIVISSIGFSELHEHNAPVSPLDLFLV